MYLKTKGDCIKNLSPGANTTIIRAAWEWWREHIHDSDSSRLVPTAAWGPGLKAPVPGATPRLQTHPGSELSHVHQKGLSPVVAVHSDTARTFPQRSALRRCHLGCLLPLRLKCFTYIEMAVIAMDWIIKSFQIFTWFSSAHLPILRQVEEWVYRQREEPRGRLYVLSSPLLSQSLEIIGGVVLAPSFHCWVESLRGFTPVTFLLRRKPWGRHSLFFNRWRSWR